MRGYYTPILKVDKIMPSLAIYCYFAIINKELRSSLGNLDFVYETKRNFIYRVAVY